MPSRETRLPDAIGRAVHGGARGHAAARARIHRQGHDGAEERCPAKRRSCYAAKVALSAQASLKKEEDAVRKLVDGVRARPPFLQGYEIELKEDSTGAPAVWVSLLVDPDHILTSDELRHLNAFTSSVKERIFASGVRREPYIRIRSVNAAPRRTWHSQKTS